MVYSNSLVEQRVAAAAFFFIEINGSLAQEGEIRRKSESIKVLS